MKKVSVIPNTILLNSLRDVGYTETMAICDIVDNAIDAKAKQIDIIISSIKNKVTKIEISDNGIGMNKNTLIQSLTLGSNVIRNTASLGHYGMGLKTAGLALATKIDILTKESNKTGAYSGVFDLKSMIISNTFSISIGKSKKKTIGTTIILRDVDKLTSATEKTYTKNLKNKLSEVFTKILNKVNITVNGENILSKDIFLEKTSKNYNLDIKTKVLTSPYNINFEISTGIKKKDIEIDLWKLPLNTKVSQKEQGFYVFRNDRLIASGLELGVYDKTSDMNYFRGAIYLNNVDDVKDAIGLNFSKQGVNFNDALEKDLRWKLKPALDIMKTDIQAEKAKLSIKNNSIENKFAKLFTKRFKLQKGIAWALGVYNGMQGIVSSTGIIPPSVKKITSRKGIITNKPTAIPINTVKTISKPPTKSIKPPTPTTPSKNSKNSMPAGANTLVKITKMPLGKNAGFWKFNDLSNNAVEIILNIDHDYYKKKYMSMSDIKKELLLETIVIVARGMVTSGLVNDDNETMIEDMFDNFGDDYRQFV